jgi:hypothetical protein
MHGWTWPLAGRWLTRRLITAHAGTGGFRKFRGKGGHGPLMAGKRAAMTRLCVSRDKFDCEYKFKWDNNIKRTGIASPYFHNSYICIKIMLITSPKRTPLIKSSNMSTWKMRLHHMASYYKLQKGKQWSSMSCSRGWMNMHAWHRFELDACDFI